MKPGPRDTHMITGVPKKGQPRKITLMYGTEEECRARMEHIREQEVRTWAYRITPIPGREEKADD